MTHVCTNSDTYALPRSVFEAHPKAGLLAPGYWLPAPTFPVRDGPVAPQCCGKSGLTSYSGATAPDSHRLPSLALLRRATLGRCLIVNIVPCEIPVTITGLYTGPWAASIGGAGWWRIGRIGEPDRKEMRGMHSGASWVGNTRCGRSTLKGRCSEGK